MNRKIKEVKLKYEIKKHFLASVTIVLQVTHLCRGFHFEIHLSANPVISDYLLCSIVD